ncbi:MAG: hypothetical protein LBK68_04955 [Candidatus Margulisbacteria bacterium]|jgi:hypothetical protein|nr:hypothetical protein [Candidatus Margulisiibacteriota bacterium]
MMQTKQIAMPLDLELEMNFPKAACLLDPPLAEKLKHLDAKLVRATDVVFSNIFKNASIYWSFWDLYNAIDEISSHLWLISKNNPVFSNTAPEIIEKNHDIYLRAKENAQRLENLTWEIPHANTIEAINELLKEKFTDQPQKKFIQDIKIIHAWIKHLLKLAADTEQTKN